MMNAVARAGLRVPLGARVGSVEDLDDWLAASRVLPVVVKPAASAGSEGVYFCADEAQARARPRSCSARRTPWASRTTRCWCRSSSSASSTSSTA
ncbi:hypothetical protein [Micromonospora tarensis]|uniref:ATP-grasp domain-containing protein n=1 Tax=Micromonospora tarensis TaxID=2806100 RepID=A0ABS1YGU9_9ACTN|nr:hypothetical protein [Micromonospora tarensis]MBM0276638.1 hypothetical protein [Micromonospora tarensis]